MLAQHAEADGAGQHHSGATRDGVDPQYKDDVAGVIAGLRSDRPDANIRRAGHSMGGGIALGFALQVDRPTVADYLLFAPIFGPGPTTPEFRACSFNALASMS